MSDHDESRSNETTETNPLVDLFQAKGIRIIGAVEDPLFCAADVAKYIGDTHSARTLQELDESEIRWIKVIDAQCRPRQMRFLTEDGLYSYLMWSKRPLAGDFRKYARQLLKAERRRVVDDARLSARIAQTKYEESEIRCKEMQKEMVRLRQDRANAELDLRDHRRAHQTMEEDLAELAELQEIIRNQQLC